MGGGGAVRRPRSPVFFCPLLKKSAGNPYLKIFYFSHLLIADTPMKFFFDKFCLHPLTALFRHSVHKYFFIFAFIKKIFLQTLVEIIF